VAEGWETGVHAKTRWVCHLGKVSGQLVQSHDGGIAELYRAKLYYL